MKKVLNLVFASAMVLSLAFVGDAVSANNPLSVNAQTVTVKRDNNVGIARRTSRGAKYVYRKARNGTVYVYRKTAQGTVYVGKRVYSGGKYVTVKSAQGAKYVGKKTYKGGRKVVSRAKKILY